MGDVIDGDFVTRLPIDPDKVLEGAKGQLDLALVLGYDKYGELYIASSHPGKADLSYLVDRFKHDLMNKY